MEALVSIDWTGKRVLVTGHTGFKGGWLALWLHALGARVSGYALPPQNQPSLFEAARIGEVVDSRIGDVRDLDAVAKAVEAARPEVIFHLAAQPLVRLSYQEPVETYATNVMGTVHVLEAARRLGTVKAVVAVTSDKCYENREWPWPYRESDPMGGHDPYSSSKGCAELVTAAYRSSYFALEQRCLVASVRAGNVIGGGDWSQDRLIPDIIRALEAGAPPLIRSPGSVRPWQHVLEAVHGYLLVAERLLAGDARAACGWNFGPDAADALSVGAIAKALMTAWGAEVDWTGPTAPGPHEAGLLRLDSSRARAELGWAPSMNVARALEAIVDWHKAVSNGADARAVTLDQITGHPGYAGMALREAA